MAAEVKSEWIAIPEENGEYHYQCPSCGMIWFLACGDPVQNEMAFCPRCGQMLIREICSTYIPSTEVKDDE